jgi:prepilin-type N-terminal cleavage/methylation domain-containing protein/prepilin-type processing-associated H-X9-DG protein
MQEVLKEVKRYNFNMRSQLRAFTLMEVLVTIAVIAVLAAILLPAFAQARESARQSVCVQHMRQVGQAFWMYLQDYDERLPDRRDLKSVLGYRPWNTWPPSDPRCGWAAVVLEPYVRHAGLWSCPSVTGSVLGEAVQVKQAYAPDSFSRYWMWRFDRIDVPTPVDNFWGKTPEQALADLRANPSPFYGRPESLAEVELMVDPYFPRTIATVPAGLRGKSVHRGGRNRLFLDGHVKWLRDIRTE